MREYEEGYPVDANDRWKQGFYPDPDRRNSSNFGFASVKRDAVPGGNKAREDATDYLNERLKVMPYESTEVLFDQRVEIVSEEHMIEGALPISAGDLVKVTWNGVEYECTAFTGANNLVLFGNTGFMGGEDNGIPFMMATRTFNGEGMFGIIAPHFVGQTVSVKVEGLVVKTIDPKFGTAFRVNVWYNGSAYVADKTCAEIREAERKKYPIVGTYTNKAGKVYTMIGCDASIADLVRLAAFDVGSTDLVVYSIYIIEDGKVGVNVHSYAGTNVDEV